MSRSHPLPRRYGVVVPVKALDRAKTRLAPVGEPLRRDLVVAFLLDTLTAVLGSAAVVRVLVVSGDPAVATAVSGASGVSGVSAADGRVLVLGDEGRDLNGAVRLGATELGRTDPRLAVAVLCGDLPTLRAADLEAALAAAPPVGTAVVSDRAGTGTTSYLAADAADVDPRFGPGSFAAHLAAGAVDLTPHAGPGLRDDVDTPADLARLEERVGHRTRSVLLSRPPRDADGPLLR